MNPEARIRHSAKSFFTAACVVCAAGPAPAELIVQFGQNFTASTLGVDSQALPPDANGTAGPSHYVEFINGRFSVYSKASGARVQTMSDLTFWSRAGVSVPASWAVTDPRLIYDPSVQRWFAAQIDFDPNGVITTNRFLLAVSATADPTGTWRGVAIPADPTGNTSADFPGLGLDASGVYLSGDMFDAAGLAVGPALVSVPKANLLANPPVVANRTAFGVKTYATRGYIQQPVVCVDASTSGQVLATGSLGISQFTGRFVTNTTLISSPILNAAGPGSATLANASFLAVPPYTSPVNPPQPDGTTNLDNGDARFSAAVYAVAGVLYAIHGTEVSGRAALRWYRIRAADNALLESGTLADPVLDLFYPSIAASTNGTVAIAFNGCSRGTYLSAYAAVGQTVNGATTFQAPILLKAGVADYHDMFETSSNPSRWGDYSATCVDPADPNRFWTIQIFASAKNVWSAQITELRTCDPTLSIHLAGTNAVVSWPGTAVALHLEASTNLLATNGWTVITQNFTTNYGEISVSVPLATGARWFRLHKP